MRLLVFAALLSLALAGQAAAQDYPSRVITIVVPLPPGGGTDTLARTLADHMRATLGQPVIIENVPGAGGTLGIARVARAAPDGYTLGVGNWAAYVAASATYPVHYDVLKDLEAVAKLADTPLWMVARATLPAHDLNGLIGWLKDNPDKASAGIVGFGSGGHICGLSFQNATGTRYEFVPYKGGALAMQDLVAGHIDLMCDMAANSLPQARAGSIRPMAVLSNTRWFAAPEVPTMEENGVPGLALSLWHGMWAPRGTPAEVVTRLHEAVSNALADPVVRTRYAEQGQEIPPPEQQTPQGFQAFHRAEVEKWSPIIKAANVKNEKAHADCAALASSITSLRAMKANGPSSPFLHAIWPQKNGAVYVSTYNVLIMGASYGSLLATKLLFGGNTIKLICLPAEAEAINKEGARVRLPIKGRKDLVEIESRKLPGSLSADGPGAVNPSDYDLVALAMQEPQYRSAGVRELLNAVARSKVPCMSIMNMPPLPYLKRIPGLATDALRSCYTDATVWEEFDPALMTLCSPDPQAFRPPDEPVNVLQVTLPTNFKVARFPSDKFTGMLREMAAGIEAIRYDAGDGKIELPVKLKVHDSIFVPLAKWAMLLTGNYRCVQPDAARSIKDAVHTDLEASRQVYNWVCELCMKLGASSNDLVPFEKYAAAAQGLVRPSSAARALFAGAPNIERVDRLVQSIAAQKGMRNPVVDETVALVDARLAMNRKAAA